MKLALGTAQFGLNYGVANSTGQMNYAEAKKTLALAKSSGVDLLDTAIAYGDSEVCLGDLGISDFKIVTKIPGLPEKKTDVVQWINDQLHASHSRLGVGRIYGLLLHRSQQITGADGKLVYRAMQRLKELGLVEKIGVSIYAPNELEAVLATGQIDIVQCPLSLVDRRLHTTGWLYRLKANNVEVHVRSVFLQGLLLMSYRKIPERFHKWQGIWKVWNDWLKKNPDISATQACLGYVNQFSEVDRIIVGVDNLSQFKELLRSFRTSMIDSYPDLACNDENLVHPFNWERL